MIGVLLVTFTSTLRRLAVCATVAKKIYQDIVWKLCLLDGIFVSLQNSETVSQAAILPPPFTLLPEKSRVRFYFFIPYRKNWPWEGNTPTGRCR